MYWNYRVVRKGNENSKILAIHEVYYTDGSPTSVTIDPVGVVGETLEELIRTLEMMALSTSKPILQYEDIGSPDDSSVVTE